MAFLLVAHSEVCGIAAYDTLRTPYGMARASCAKGYYTFGHEVGHILGAMHNVGKGEAHYDYSYGLLIEPTSTTRNGGYRTIMA